MTSFEVALDDKRVRQALRRGPAVLEKHMRRAITRTVQEMARTARRGAPKAHSTLANSIVPTTPSPLEGRVTAGTEYARYVEEDTGSQNMPPLQAIVDWLRVKRIAPRDPSMSVEQLGFVVARAIARRGTPAQPYMGPAFSEHQASGLRRLNDALEAAIAAM